MCDPIGLPNILVPILWKSNNNWANSDFFPKISVPPHICDFTMHIHDFGSFFLNFTVWKLTGLFTNRGYLCVRGNKYFSNNIPKKIKGVVKMTRKLGKHDFLLFFLVNFPLGGLNPLTRWIKNTVGVPMCDPIDLPNILVPILWKSNKNWANSDFFSKMYRPPVYVAAVWFYHAYSWFRIFFSLIHCVKTYGVIHKSWVPMRSGDQILSE